jgi:hypothetical protein
MVGRKPIVSARHSKARCQVNLRATDFDVAQNSEMNRLIDMVEAMQKAGVLGDFLLDSLWSKLRQDEGKTVFANRMVEGGYRALPPRPTEEAQIHHSQHQAPTTPVPANAEPRVPESVERDPVQREPEPILVRDQAAEVETVAQGRDANPSPSSIIDNVLRGIESAQTVEEPNNKDQVPTPRSRPRGNMLSAMG